MEKTCYYFLTSETTKVVDGSSEDKNLLGGKGANLAGMAKLGLPVPPGFTIPTTLCVKYMNTQNAFTKKTMMNSIASMAASAYEELCSFTGHPVLVSVRSGARVSMPGMMDTVLNVGLTSKNLDYWADKLGERTALDSYRRLLQMYGEVVMGIDKHDFQSVLAALKKEAGVTNDSDLSALQLGLLVEAYHVVYANAKKVFPDTVEEQLAGAIEAVFNSWNNHRAKVYRQLHGYPDDWGTAVTVQTMVFGNLNEHSATGVMFSRCPSTGNSGVVGEFLVNAQGEDVVAGTYTPMPLSSMVEWNPKAYDELLNLASLLEMHSGDVQDIEFTIQDGKVYLLQTRNAKRTHQAAVKIAYQMAKDSTGKFKYTKALAKIPSAAYEDGVSVSVVSDTPHDYVGIAAGGNAVRGVLALTSQSAVMKANAGNPVILVADETTPDDIEGMAASVGILTRTGGLTSHAAVVARGMNKVCVVGCETLPSLHDLPDNTLITICGKTGRVWINSFPVLSEPSTDPLLEEIFSKVCVENGFTPAWKSVEGMTLIDLDEPAGLEGVSNGFVELNPMIEPYTRPEDLKLVESMGIPVDKAVADDILVAMGAAVKTLAHDGRVTLSCPDWIHGRLGLLLKQAGMDSIEFCKSPKNIKELFDGVVVLDDACITNVFGDKKTAKHFLKLLAGDGKKVVEAPVVKTKAQMVCEFMGGH